MVAVMEEVARVVVMVAAAMAVVVMEVDAMAAVVADSMAVVKVVVTMVEDLVAAAMELP